MARALAKASPDKDIEALEAEIVLGGASPAEALKLTSLVPSALARELLEVLGIEPPDTFTAGENDDVGQYRFDREAFYVEALKLAQRLRREQARWLVGGVLRWRMESALVAGNSNPSSIAMLLLVNRLTWNQVDPASSQYDPDATARVARRILVPVQEQPGTRTLENNALRDRLESDLDSALLETFGPWVAGWNWAATEGGGGGPVDAWCCGRHSVLPDGEAPETTVQRVVDAVAQWREFLEAVAQVQSPVLRDTAGMPVGQSLERALSAYLPLVLEHTGASDAWYDTLRVVLNWHLQAAGVDDQRLRQALASVTSACFESWIEPAPAVVQNALAALRLEFARDDFVDVQPDALAEWLKLRERLDLKAKHPWDLRQALKDGHRTYIDSRDRQRSEERASRMHRALSFVRAANRPLSWELLTEAQAIVLGDDDVGFRTTDAFAKHGRERYSTFPGLKEKFQRCIAEANDRKLSAVLRAARVYLDVCFFHPFADGNARSARLALDHVLTQDGLSLQVADPVFAFPVDATDEFAAWRLIQILQQVVRTQTGDGP